MKADRARAINSAAGVASQMPFTPRSIGNTIMVININTNDLENARMADTTPLDNAVNIPLAKILNPIKSKAIVHILFPDTASAYTGLSGRAKTDTSGLVSPKEAAAIIPEITAITLMLILTSFFSFSKFCSP